MPIGVVGGGEGGTRGRRGILESRVALITNIHMYVWRLLQMQTDAATTMRFLKSQHFHIVFPRCGLLVSFVFQKYIMEKLYTDIEVLEKIGIYVRYMYICICICTCIRICICICI